MELLDIGALFVTTFLGAFLAFGLENLRERRRLTRWVRQHLGHLREMIAGEEATVGEVNSLLAKKITACDAWLTAEKPDEITDEQWELLGSTAIAHAPDFGAVLRSEALTVIPPDLGVALSRTEAAGAQTEDVSRQVLADFESVQDRWFDRTVPLSEPDRRRLRRLRDHLVELQETVDQVRQPLRALLAGIEGWIY